MGKIRQPYNFVNSNGMQKFTIWWTLKNSGYLLIPSKKRASSQATKNFRSF